MTADFPRPHGCRGRVRPGPSWRRYDARALRLDRLAADLDVEADRWPEGSPVHAVVSSAASALRTAAATVTTESD